MKTNLGGIDRAVRIVAGIVLITLVLMGTIGWWGWIGIVPLVTGVFGFCPAYRLFGFNSCPLKRNNSI